MIDAPETTLLERREPLVGLEPEARTSVSFQNQSAERTSGDIREPSRVIWPMGCLHQIFEAQSSVRGDAPAVVCDGLVLSYSEVEAASNRLARQLRSAGAGRGSLIGLCLNRSERPVIAILACLKAGAAYVPIDPAHPDDRVRYIIEEAEVSVVICEDALVERIRPVFDGVLACLKAGAAYVPIDPAHPDDRVRYIIEEAEVSVVICEDALVDRIQPVFHGSIVSLDSDAAEIAAQSAERLAQSESGVTPADLCYVIYTSGTTGRPKGVMTEHRNAFHFVQAFNAVCATTPSDRVYQGFSLGFDGSVEEIWMAFSNGAALVVGSKDTPRFGNDLSQYLARAGVTYFSTVPTMLSTMTDDIPPLRQLIVSGEVCPPELVTRWSRPGRYILNVYGPTEATVNTTAKVCVPGEAITVGHPLPGYSTLVLDRRYATAAAGKQGRTLHWGPRRLPRLSQADGIDIPPFRALGSRRRPDLPNRRFGGDR